MGTPHDSGIPHICFCPFDISRLRSIKLYGLMAQCSTENPPYLTTSQRLAWHMDHGLFPISRQLYKQVALFKDLEKLRLKIVGLKHDLYLLLA